MAREVMRYSRTKMEPVEPVAPIAPDWFQMPEITMRPDWTEVRPPYRADSTMERAWSTALVPLRAIALLFLWITFQWWRAALALGFLVLVITVWHTG